MLENIFYNPLLQYQILGNSLGSYLFALIIFLGILLLFKIAQVVLLKYFRRLAERTKTEIDNIFIEIVQKIRPPLYFLLAAYFALESLEVNFWISKAFSAVLMAWIIYQVIVSVQILINRVVKKKIAKDVSSEAATELLGKILKGILWAVGFLFILSNLGINITSLIAGLGIGGVAVAFALQNILADLFSSFAIFFDKPFKIGDFIVVGDYKGTVERIGIKTTRIRSLQGEELVVSNRELTSAKIQNFGEMKERRISMKIRVSRETPVKKLRIIPKTIENIINAIEDIRFDRAFFVAIEDSAMVYEIVYFVRSSDYLTFLKVQQKILLSIKEEFEKQKIEIARPIQEIYLKRSE